MIAIISNTFANDKFASMKFESLKLGGIRRVEDFNAMLKKMNQKGFGSLTIENDAQLKL